MSLFPPGALWTAAHGKVLAGLEAIAAFTRAVLAKDDWDAEVTYEVLHTTFLRPDVAAVKVRQVCHAPDGDGQGAPLYVMTKRATAPGCCTPARTPRSDPAEQHHRAGTRRGGNGNRSNTT